MSNDDKINYEIKKGNYKNALKLIEKKLESAGSNNFHLKLSKCQIYNKLGRYNICIEFINKILINLEDKLLIIDFNNEKSKALGELGRLADGLEIIKQNEELIMDVESRKETKTRIAVLNDIKGILKLRQGSFDDAQNYLLIALRIRKELKNKIDIALSEKNMGNLYLNRGELDKALTKYQQSLALYKELGYQQDIALVLNNIGEIFKLEGNYEEAIQNYRKSNKILTKIGNRLHIIGNLYNLISVSILNNDLNGGEKYFQSMEEYAHQSTNFVINQVYRMSKGLIYKESKRTINRAKAQVIFGKIVNEEVIFNEITEQAMIHLSELLQSELKWTGEEEVFDEIKELAMKISNIAEVQVNWNLLAESFFLRSKLALLDLDLEKTQELIERAQKIAIDKGLTVLAQKISNEYDDFLDAQDQWIELKNRNIPLKERLSYIDISEILTRLIHKSQEAILETNPEIPILFLITKVESGMKVYSKQFKDYKINEDLLSGLLSAIQTLSNNIFRGGIIQRIKHNEFTIIFNYYHNVLYSYAFTGPSYWALEKLDKTITLLNKDNKTEEMISREFVNLSKNEENYIDGLIQGIFN